jgi:hypothetical protein
MFRIGFMGHFAQIARSHHQRLIEIRSRLPPGADSPPDSDEYLEYLAAALPIEDEMAEAASIVIVFAAIAAEAYIYDFAARNLALLCQGRVGGKEHSSGTSRPVGRSASERPS